MSGVPAHPAHELVAAEVRSWYTRSTPEIGMSVHEEDYGFLTLPDSPAGRRLILTVDDPARVPAALAGAAESYGTEEFDLWVDDRQRATRLARALASVEMEPSQDIVVLGLVGPVRAVPGPDDLVVETADDLDRLRQWVSVKIRCFADSEEEPSAERIDSEMTVRQAEWPACKYNLARWSGEPVAILGHYTGSDQMVFNLATRVPFRHRGIAQSLLARWCEAGQADAVRSLLINCDDAGQPAALYRQMGFVDELYWHRRYRHHKGEQG